MGRAFITNMPDFLDEKGAVLDNLSLKSKRLLKNLNLIIEAVGRSPLANEPTSNSNSNPKPIVLNCWSAPYKKRCKGKIDASIELPGYDILWHCLLCGNHGRICKWRG
jgi:hypothetical protein